MSTQGALKEAIDQAILFIEWERPVSYEALQEIIGGWPRYQTERRPNKVAQKRANLIREIAGYPLVDYKKEYPE